MGPCACAPPLDFASAPHRHTQPSVGVETFLSGEAAGGGPGGQWDLDQRGLPEQEKC